MSAPLTPAASRPLRHFLPVTVWLCIQLLALTAGATQIQLSDQFPRPAEQLALDVMLAVQLGTSAMLFPLLLRNLTSTLLVIASTWPFIQIAGILAAVPSPSILLAGCYVSVWLVFLALARSLPRSEKSMMFVVMVMTAVSIGGALMWYLKAEFSPDASQVPSSSSRFMGPIVDAIGIAHGQTNAMRIWGPMIVAFMHILPLALYRRLRKPVPMPA